MTPKTRCRVLLRELRRRWREARTQHPWDPRPVKPADRLAAYAALAPPSDCDIYRRAVRPTHMPLDKRQDAPVPYDANQVKRQYHLAYVAWLLTQARGGTGDEVVRGARPAEQMLRERAKEDVVAFRRRRA